MASSKLLLSILQTEYETPAVGEWVTSRQADVEDGMEARHTTSGGARSAVVAYWNDGSDEPLIVDNDDDPGEALAGGLHNSLPTSEFASAPTESIDASGPWYDVEEGRYIEELAPGLRSHEQQRAFCSRTSPTPDPPSIIPATARSDPPARCRQTGIGFGRATIGVIIGPHAYLPKSSLGRGTQDEIQSQERSETTGSRPEELRDACRCGTPAQGLEWEQRETRVAIESLGWRELGEEALMEEVGGVEIRQQGELAGWPAVGDQQNKSEVDNTDDSMDKEATKALPATQLEIDKHRIRLRGIRTQQLPGRQTKTTQYRVIWGEHPKQV
ncbi:hypothetical protein B0J14DRAFT_659238 [Halenospora varia]|nr:hypothetical protein B0J14DRAFT_659238 [Halenospora varia]